MDISELLSSSKKQSSLNTTQNSNSSDEEQEFDISKKTLDLKLDEKLKELSYEHDEKETEKKARELSLPYVNLTKLVLTADSLSLLDESIARKLFIIPIYYKENEILRLGLVNYPPSNEVQKIIDDLKNEFKVKVELVLVSKHGFEKALYLYKTVPKFLKIQEGVQITQADLDKYKAELSDFRELNKKVQEVSMSDLVTLIIAASLKFRASDIHIEAEEDGIKVRFRIDGLLNDVAVLSSESWNKLISRIKLLSKLKINIRNIPQDGRFTIFLDNEHVDVRVSTLPTAYGESVVMRLLKSSAASLQFEDLGLRGLSKKRLEEEIQKTNGMIITTGPTGSGKTTTLYAILNKLNDSETKIITLEDPIEYKLKGINQSQIDHSANYNFADGLRSILRQDPDVVMVGELRDFETADVAINAALTGHLVISTIHTNSASAAVPRFLAMGVKAFLLAPAINAIMGQRLCRRVCQNCKEEVQLDTETLEKVKSYLAKIPESSGERVDLDNLHFYKGRGCDKCSGLGYKGRVGIYEILTMNKEIEDLILSEKVSEYEIEKIAVSNGMLLMIQDGLLKALDGITTVEEVFRVAL